jgi:methionyl-tRNA synthetase
MATLITRFGDPQALKAAMAAQVTGQTLTIISSSEAKRLSEDVLPAFGGSDLALILADGSVLGEPNAMARHLGSSLASASDLSAASWLEWEAAVLRPAVYAGDDATLASALERIPSGVNFLGGSSLGLADCVVAPTLHAGVLLNKQLNSAASSYLQNIASQPSFTKALELINAVTTSNKFQQISAVASDAAAFVASRPKLPIPGQRNILITSALPYVNNVPHLGNIIGCVLSADVYARFCRSRKYNCIYVCGTDEYGTATETKALEENLTCQEICDKYHAIHRGIYEWFDISFDKFGRTPTRAQTAIGHEMFLELQNNNRLVEQTMEQLYSEPLQKFLADRYVVGTCPKCRYEDARGDQCDQCGSLLNPTELINPKCKLSGTTPIVKQTKHIFLNLPALSEDLQNYITTASAQGGWTSNCVQVTKAWMDQGLKVRCITRDLKWGTPVPMAGYEDKVFYVWFDAPIGYVSITAGYCGEDWRAWWLPQEYYNSTSNSTEVPDVELVQFMGKDNVPFHTVIFPASQLGTGRKWTMMKNISVTEYLNYEDGKFSKSRGVGVFGNDAKETGIEVEVWRYYLLAIRPEVADSAFQWDDFASKNNADLNDNLGNFINRTLKFVHARFEGAVPGVASDGSVSSSALEAISALGEKVSSLVSQYIEAMEAQKMKSALQGAMSVSRAGNGFFQETEIWKAVKEDRSAAAAYISACVGIVAVAASLLQPFMPSFTSKCLEQLGLENPLAFTDDLVEMVKDIANVVPAGHTLDTKEPTPLFRKITDAEVAEFREKFAGSQADRAAAEAGGGKKDAATVVGGEKKAKVKGGEKANGAAPAAAPAASAAAAAAAAPKKEKKAASASDKDLPVDISRIDLRVGHIRKAWRHPDAESLYVEEVDVGEAEPRTVVSGLVKYIPEAEMQDRKVVLVCNLKPANMRGIKSQAMVLAATSLDGDVVELVEPPAGAVVGERVFVEGFNTGNEPDEVLNPKKKIWEAVQPDLKTDDHKNACYKGVALRTASGVCTVKSVVGGSIK